VLACRALGGAACRVSSNLCCALYLPIETAVDQNRPPLVAPVSNSETLSTQPKQNKTTLYNPVRYECNTIQYSTARDDTKRHNTAPYTTTQHNTKQCNTVRYDTIQYYTRQYNTVRDGTILYNTVDFNTAQYDTIHYNPKTYNTIRYDKIRYDTARHDTSR